LRASATRRSGSTISPCPPTNCAWPRASADCAAISRLHRRRCRRPDRVRRQRHRPAAAGLRAERARPRRLCAQRRGRQAADREGADAVRRRPPAREIIERLMCDLELDLNRFGGGAAQFAGEMRRWRLSPSRACSHRRQQDHDHRQRAALCADRRGGVRHLSGGQPEAPFDRGVTSVIRGATESREPGIRTPFQRLHRDSGSGAYAPSGMTKIF